MTLTAAMPGGRPDTPGALPDMPAGGPAPHAQSRLAWNASWVSHGTFVVIESSHSAQLALSPEVGILPRSGEAPLKVVDGIRPCISASHAEHLALTCSRLEHHKKRS